MRWINFVLTSRSRIVVMSMGKTPFAKEVADFVGLAFGPSFCAREWRAPFFRLSLQYNAAFLESPSRDLIGTGAFLRQKSLIGVEIKQLPDFQNNTTVLGAATTK
jgi:hypothetical protein